MIPRLILIASLVLSIEAAERRVVFAVVPYDPWAIEPIVMLDPIAKPTESSLKRRTYELSVDGNVIGKVEAGERTELGCISIAAKATLDPDQAVGQTFLATNFTPRKSRDVREATNEELANLRAYAERYLRARELPVTNLEAIADVVDLGDGDPLFVASLWTNSSALFLLARVSDVSPSRAAPQLVEYQPRDDSYGSHGKQPLFALIDLDEDGLAEVITQRHHKEGYDYLVYRRTGAEWSAFEGGGSGC